MEANSIVEPTKIRARSLQGALTLLVALTLPATSFAQPVTGRRIVAYLIVSSKPLTQAILSYWTAGLAANPVAEFALVKLLPTNVRPSTSEFVE